MKPHMWESDNDADTSAMLFTRSMGQRRSEGATRAAVSLEGWQVRYEAKVSTSQALCNARQPSKLSAPEESGDKRQAARTCGAVSVGAAGDSDAANATAASQHRVAQRLYMSEY